MENKDRWSTGNSMVDDFPIDEAESTHFHQSIDIDEKDDIGEAINDIFNK